MKRWTLGEDKYLLKHWYNTEYKYIQEELPHRSYDAIRKRVSVLRSKGARFTKPITIIHDL